MLHRHLFALLGSMYLCKPTRESLAGWRQLLTDEPLAGTEELRQALNSINLDSEQELEDILWEYTRLFIGPNRLPCPPLESVYTSPKRLMMQEAHDRVQEFYVRIGLEIGNADVMPDHIGAELSFLALLSDKRENEKGKRSFYEASAEEFLTSHLRNWVPRFTADMEDSAETFLYQALARITKNTILA